MRRKTLLLMLLMALFSSGAWAQTQTVYTSYTYDNGTSSYASDQSPAKLVDNIKNSNSKWCVTSFSSYSPIYVEFHSTDPIIPVGYVMTTGGDCASWTGRNPRSWIIKAKRNSSDSWAVIADESNNTTLQDVDLQDYTFNLNNSTEYQYFRFEVSAIASGNTFQLTELQFLVNNGGGGSGTTVSWGSISDNNGTSDELAISPIGRHYGWEYKVYCYRPNTLPFSGDITQIGFLPSTTQSTPGTASSSVTVNGVSDSNPMQIWMKEVDGNTSLDANTTFATYASGATKVYSGNIPATTSGTMNHFSLSTSFSHSQENSLLILVRTKSNSNSGDGALYCYNKILTGGVNLSWSKRQDSSDPGISVSGSVTQNKLPVLEVTYNSNTQTCEGFESDLGGWISTAQDDSYKWARKTGTGGGSYNTAGEGSYNVGAYKSSRINKYTYLTYCADLSSCTDIYISYKYINPAWSSDIDYIYLQTSTDGTNYTNLKSHTSSHTSWTQESNVSIPNGTKYIRFAAYGNYGYGVGLDEICLEYSGSPTYITEIASVDDWNAFCAAVNSGYSYSGKTVTMTADVGTVNTICGKLTGVNDTTPKAFSGTFDGGGHTLTVNYTDQPRFAAPFKFLDGATIRNLRTSGTITGSSNNDGKVIAGLVGVSKGTTNIIGCSSNVNITSYYNNGDDVALSGLVAAINGGTLTVEGCAFEGSLTASTSNNNHNGGIVGYWYSGTHVYVRNTVFAPTALNVTTGDTGYSFTIARTTNNAQVTIENCYYTQVLGNAQGKQRYTITGQSPATVAMSGTETNYGASGIKAYKNGSTQLPGLVYNGTIIAGSSETVNLSLGYTGSGILSGYQASNGTLSGNALTGSNDAYTLSSITANSVITAASFQDAYLIDFETAALDQFGFVNDGSYPWVVTDCSNSTNSVAPYAGSYCMMSGNYNVANTESAMQMTVEFTSPGSISFYWLSSGEGSSWDYGKFYVNGSQITSTNVASWNQYTYPVTAGTYTFKWAYRKDGSVNSYDDRLYVDNIVFASNGNFVAVIPDPTAGGTATVGSNGAQGIFVADGGSTALTATPASGYHLVNWTENGSTLSSSNPYTLSNITANHVVKANFSNTCTLTTSVNPSEGGSITCSPTGNNGVYNYGTQVQLTATPNTGYQFTGWMVDGSSAGSTNPYTITMNTDHNVVANFQLNSYNIQASVDPANSGTIQGTGSYNHGATATLTATPANNYRFVNWTKNGSVVSSDNPYSFTATEDATYTANFSLNQHTLTINYVDGNGATVAPQHTSTVSYGDTYAVASPAVTGYTPDQATVSGTMPDSDVTVTVTYSINSYQLTIVYEYADHSTAATTYTAQLDYGESYNVASPAITCYSPSQATVSGNMPANNLTVTVTYTMKEYTIIVASDGNGSVSIANASGSQVTVSCGTQVTIVATPNTGYSLVNWTNDLNATTVTDNPYQFTANETIFGNANSITLVANFDLTPPSFTTTVNSVTDNSVNMSGAVTYGGNITEYGFCWNTTGETPTSLVAGSYYRVGNGVPSASFTQNITGLTSNTLYYVWSYVVSNSTVMCGDRQTFTTLAQVTTASATNVTTYDATMGGSWATGGGATITGCGVVYGTGSTPTIGDGTSTQVAMASPSSPFTLQNSSNLLAETTYYVRAYVTNAGGTSYGSAVSFTTLGYYGIAYMVSPAASDGVITFSPAGDGQGQGTKVIPVGNGNNASQMFPLMGTTSTSFDEMLYPALTIDGNAVQGDIQSISFFVKTKATGAQNPTLDIYLMETSSTTLTSGVAIPVANLCYSGTVSVSNLNTWVDITLDTPFAYQGGNLIVAVDYSGSGAYTWASSDATGKSLCFMRSVTSGGNINGDVNYGTWTEDQMGLSSNQLPNAKFTIATASGNTEWCSYGYTTTASASTLNPDYVFDHWTVDGTDVSGNTPTYTFNNITADHTITANFVLTYKRFVFDGNWNVAGNWDPEGVPTLSDEIAIEANAIIPSGVIGYANNIRPITHANSSITIKDGGQLVHNNGSNNMVTVTVEDTIVGYGAAIANTNKDYEILSFPVSNLTAGSNAITGLLTGAQHPFDFYSFYASEDPLEWLHQTADSTLSLMKGYIYASQDGTTIRVTGPVMSSANDVNSTAVDFLNANAPRFNGWALMGNPFVCNAYVSLGTNNGAGAEANFYKLNHTSGYDEFVPFSSGDAVTPMGGVMFRVYDDDYIVYSRTAPGRGTGILNMDVNKVSVRGAETLDRARVRFGEGRNLEKFQFDTRHTKIYIPEGDQDFSVYYADGAGTIPVNFKAQDNGRYTLDFSTEEVSFNYLHLIDNMNGNDVDLLQTPYYAFDAKSTDFASRFTLVFATGNDNDDTFAFFNNGVWIINNDGDATLQVVDALGRMLSSENISGSTSKAINVAPGVYMLRLINGDKVKVQKIVVKR